MSFELNPKVTTNNKLWKFCFALFLALFLDFFFWPFVHGSSDQVATLPGKGGYLSTDPEPTNPRGTIPTTYTVYAPDVTATFHSPVELYSGQPISLTLEPTEVPWHNAIVSTTATTPDYGYALKVYSNYSVSQTQNFHLSIEVFLLHNVSDASEGYASLIVPGGVTKTLPYFADDALLTTFNATQEGQAITKGLLKFRVANVVFVIASQGLKEVYSEDFLLTYATLTKQKVK